MAKVVRRNPLTAEKSGAKIGDAYMDFLRSRKSQCSQNTVEIYQEIGERHIVPALTEYTGDDMYKITREILQCIIDDYHADHSVSGTNFLYRHMKTFINWYWDEYEVPSGNPIRKIKPKKESAKPKQGITRDEVDALLRTAKAKSIFPERDIAMLMILCDTGIRRSSLANLKMSDVNTTRCEMTVFEKDQQYHVKAFGQATCKAVKKYLSCLQDVKPTDPFWLCMDGTVLGWKGMREVLRRLCAEAKIPMHHFHDFRRFYALELYNTTHDIYLVSRALDHKDVTVTKRYIRIDEIEDNENARIYSPMDRKFGQTGIRVSR